MQVNRVTYSARWWPGMRSEYNWLPPDPSAVTRTGPYQVGVSFHAHSQVVYETGGRARYLTVPAGAVFATGGSAVRWAEVTEPTEALEIFPELAAVQAVVDEAAGPGGARPVEIDSVIAGEDGVLLAIAAAVKQAHLHDLPVEPLAGSLLAHRLIVHVAGYYARPRADDRRLPGRLDRTLVDRVARLVDERMGDALSLDDLAAEARLSVYHFARAFKRTTALTPYEFVTMRRMERAKQLLLSTGHSAVEIARRTGYSNVGHFRRLLRRYTGFSPAALRHRG